MSLFRVLADGPLPMPFNSGVFFLFFTLFLLGYVLVPRRRTPQLLYVLGFSLVYYVGCNGILVLSLLFSTVVDYSLARAIHRSRRPRVRGALLLLSIGMSLSVLGYFKYASFAWQSLAFVAGLRVDPFSIAAPIGISFYTFQSIGYVVDVYRRQVEPTESLLEYAFFLSFFPQMGAGPIARASELFPQIRKASGPTEEMTREGLTRIASGLAKKAILADFLGGYCSVIFDNPISYSGPEVVLAFYAYGLQIYFDFSGYSDIAIGLAGLLGIRLPENFDAPYRASSLGEFWRRWHMTLSRWVRDYLVFPMHLSAGRRVWLRYATIVLAMTLVGLWHGAAFTFIVWGAMHGLALAAEAWVARRSWARRWRASRWAPIVGWVFTFHFVLLSWVLFRADSFATAGILLERTLLGWHGHAVWTVVHARKFLILAAGLGGLLSIIPPGLTLSLRRRSDASPAWVKAAVFLAVVQAAVEVQAIHVQPFIYLQF